MNSLVLTILECVFKLGDRQVGEESVEQLCLQAHYCSLKVSGVLILSYGCVCFTYMQADRMNNKVAL